MDLSLEKLNKNLQLSHHKHSKKTGKWSWWFVKDEEVLNFLEDSFIEDEDTELKIKNALSYYKLIDLLKKIYEKNNTNNRKT